MTEMPILQTIAEFIPPFSYDRSAKSIRDGGRKFVCWVEIDEGFGPRPQVGELLAQALTFYYYTGDRIKAITIPR